MVIFSENKQSEVCSDQKSSSSKCIQENFRPSNTQSWQQLFSVRISPDLQTQITKDKICQAYKQSKLQTNYFQSEKVVGMASAFADVQSAPPIEVFQLGRDFAADPNPKKVTLVLKVEVWRRTCF